jgi:hypothetical protein
MTNETREGPSLNNLMTQLTAAQDRAHQSSERAAQQFTKLLGTLHGGLGIAIAAWLQRIFEQAGNSPLSPLAWYLAVALFFVALGLAILVLTAIIDQRSAYHAALSIVHNTTRAWHHKEGAHIQQLGMEGDEKSEAELAFAAEDEELIRKTKVADESAGRLNAFSEGLGIASWLSLVAAFLSLAIGIVKTLSCLA